MATRCVLRCLLLLVLPITVSGVIRYTFVNESLSYSAAEQHCQTVALGGTLASPNSAAENRGIFGAALAFQALGGNDNNMTDAPFWLGGGRATVQLPEGGRYHERHVTWTRPDGETYSRPELGAAWIDPQPFMAWLPDEPNANVNNGRDACTYVPAGQSDGRWDDTLCADEKPFVCQATERPLGCDEAITGIHQPVQSSYGNGACDMPDSTMATVNFSTTDPIVSATFEICGLSCLMCVDGVEAAVPRLGEPTTCINEGRSRQITVPYTAGTAVEVSFGCMHYADAADLNATLLASCTMPPTAAPTLSPTVSPTWSPTVSPTVSPTMVPSAAPTSVPTTHEPTPPSLPPSAAPTTAPSTSPSASPTSPTLAPTALPTPSAPSSSPTAAPITAAPTTLTPTPAPTITAAPTPAPTPTPTVTLGTGTGAASGSGGSGDDGGGSSGAVVGAVVVAAVLLVLLVACVRRKRRREAAGLGQKSTVAANPLYAAPDAIDDRPEDVPTMMLHTSTEHGSVIYDATTLASLPPAGPTTDEAARIMYSTPNKGESCMAAADDRMPYSMTPNAEYETTNSGNQRNAYDQPGAVDDVVPASPATGVIFSSDKLATLPSAGSAGAPSGGPGGGNRQTVFLDDGPARALYGNDDAIQQSESSARGDGGAAGGAVIPSRPVYGNIDPAGPAWLHAQITSREQAERLLREQPDHPDRLYYLVRPRAGVDGSFALGMFARGTMVHVLLEQPAPGQPFMVDGARHRSSPSTLKNAVTAAVTSANRKPAWAGCTPVPMQHASTAISEC